MMQFQAKRKSLNNTLSVLEELRQLFEPPPSMTVSQWADERRILHPESTGVSGRWNTDTVPALRAVMDAYNDPAVRRIVIKGCVRIGKSQAACLNVIGYAIDMDPRRIMVGLPDKQLVDDFVSTKLEPMLRTETLASRVDPGGKGRGKNNEKLKTFRGGFVSIANANTAVSFRQREVDVVIGDEIDAWPLDCEGEGDPVGLLCNRVTNSPNPKEILISSPTIEGQSRIDAAYQDSTQEVFEIPCPGCGHFQELLFFVDDEVNPLLRFKDAHLGCLECGKHFGQWEWLGRADRGRWRANNPGHKTRGFWLTGMISPWFNWADLIAEFFYALSLARYGDFTKLKSFKNTKLAVLWVEDLGSKLDDKILYKRRELYQAEIPSEVLLLTCGVDTQDNYLAYTIWGWGRDNEGWGIESGFCHGDPAKKEAWSDLTKLVYEREFRVDSRVMRINRILVDYQGHKTDFVYAYTKGKTPRLYACRGIGGESKASVVNQFQPDTDRPWRIELAVDSIKAELATRLKVQEPGPAFIHFPKGDTDADVSGFDEQYFSALCCERRKPKSVNGFTTYVWTKPEHARNEAWDLFVYAWGALLHLGGSKALEEAARDRESAQEKPRSSFGQAPAALLPAPDKPRSSRFGAF